MRRVSYERMARSLEKRFGEGSEISQEDYEAVVGPLFEALASADLLIDKGDLRAALRQLDLAEMEYGALCTHANLMSDADAKEFTEAARIISQKAITSSRMPAPAKAQTVVVQTQQPATTQPQVDKKPGVNENESQSR